MGGGTVPHPPSNRYDLSGTNGFLNFAPPCIFELFIIRFSEKVGEIQQMIKDIEAIQLQVVNVIIYIVEVVSELLF